MISITPQKDHSAALLFAKIKVGFATWTCSAAIFIITTLEVILHHNLEKKFDLVYIVIALGVTLAAMLSVAIVWIIYLCIVGCIEGTAAAYNLNDDGKKYMSDLVEKNIGFISKCTGKCFWILLLWPLVNILFF